MQTVKSDISWSHECRPEVFDCGPATDDVIERVSASCVVNRIADDCLRNPVHFFIQERRQEEGRSKREEGGVQIWDNMGQSTLFLVLLSRECASTEARSTQLVSRGGRHSVAGGWWIPATLWGVQLGSAQWRALGVGTLHLKCKWFNYCVETGILKNTIMHSETIWPTLSFFTSPVLRS